AYPVYTVGESGTLYSAGQSQYYAATNTGTATPTGTVGYTTTGGHYVVQQAVDTDGLITSRNSPQTTNAVSKRREFHIATKSKGVITTS
ncbi:hypothetical protein HHI36_006918, partial [Cryptolaemus montrouzieri]